MTPDQPNARAWVARCQWPGKQAFLFGTVYVRLRAPAQEVHDAVGKAMREVLPDEVASPRIIGLDPGSLVFQPEDDA